MTNSETAWKVSIDYSAISVATDTKAKLARGRGARAAIKASGYLPEFICISRQAAKEGADEVFRASGVPMRVSEVLVGLWPA